MAEEEGNIRDPKVLGYVNATCQPGHLESRHQTELFLDAEGRLSLTYGRTPFCAYLH